jgi:hypothetical protein
MRQGAVRDLFLARSCVHMNEDKYGIAEDSSSSMDEC